MITSNNTHALKQQSKCFYILNISMSTIARNPAARRINDDFSTSVIFFVLPRPIDSKK